MSEAELQQVKFPPEILDRIAPDISLKRHFAIGVRPNLRNFTEFKPIEIANSSQLQESNNNVISSSIIKSGSTTIINTITLGIIENINPNEEKKKKFTTIYPNVEILRGRSGAPTDEEMILSQNLYETIYKSKIIPSESLKINNLGISINNEEEEEKEKDAKQEILYPDLNSNEWQYINLSNQYNKSYSFILLSSIKVYSKSQSTNSLFDLCYLSIINCLKNLKLPRCYINESNLLSTKISIRSRKSNVRGLINTNNNKLNLNLDLNRTEKIKLNLTDGLISSNYGVVDIIKKEKESESENENENENENEKNNEKNKLIETILLCDLEGEAEETSILSRLTVITNKKGTMNKISLINGDLNSEITFDILKKAIEISQKRSLQQGV
ncbi:unnamed protein product [Candida verbasci]|uniref:Ribosomal RNA-processing protein 43 n=1 Tax=Candida verbasci TaxID=1227364 RepID=A0A9W4XCQ6_9ASCO|nr:unnamed protein product [Candida verbasci]